MNEIIFIDDPRRYEDLEQQCVMLLRNDPQLQILRPTLTETNRDPEHPFRATYPIDDVDGGRLGICLAGNTNLASLNIELDSTFSRRGALMLASGIRQSNLKHLKITNESIFVEDCMEILCEEAARKSTSIVKLELTGRLGNLSTLCKAILSLKVLELCASDLKDGIHLLSEAVSSTNSLQGLILYGCGITDSEMVLLSCGLRSNSSIKLLGIEDDEIGDIGVKSFVENWNDDSSIEELNFHGNKIGVDGAMGIMQVVSRHRSLRMLNLGFSDLGFDGIQKIAIMLPELRLTSFDIPGCIGIDQFEYDELEDEETKKAAVATGRAMLRAVQANVQLLECSLVYNCIPRDIEEEISLYLQLNCCGRYLLSEDAIPSGMWSYVLAGCKHCRESNSAMYFFLREQPHLLLSAVNRLPSRKRPREESMLNFALQCGASKLRRTAEFVSNLPLSFRRFASSGDTKANM